MENIFKKLQVYLKENIDKKSIILVFLAIIIFCFSVYFYSKDNNQELYQDKIESVFLEEENNEDNYEHQENDDNSSDNLLEKSQIVVEIKGEVKNPDVYYLDDGSIIKDLIEMAGGVTENAYLNNINRASVLKNNECIIINNKNDINEDINLSNNPTNMGLDNSNKDGKVNLNKATIEELKSLDGIGDAKAKSIIEYRDSNNGFKSIDDLKNVKGIGEKIFESLKDKIST